MIAEGKHVMERAKWTVVWATGRFGGERLCSTRSTRWGLVGLRRCIAARPAVEAHGRTASHIREDNSIDDIECLLHCRSRARLPFGYCSRTDKSLTDLIFETRNQMQPASCTA